METTSKPQPYNALVLHSIHPSLLSLSLFKDALKLHIALRSLRKSGFGSTSHPRGFKIGFRNV